MNTPKPHSDGDSSFANGDRVIDERPSTRQIPLRGLNNDDAFLWSFDDPNRPTPDRGSLPRYGYTFGDPERPADTLDLFDLDETERDARLGMAAARLGIDPEVLRQIVGGRVVMFRPHREFPPSFYAERERQKSNLPGPDNFAPLLDNFRLANLRSNDEAVPYEPGTIGRALLDAADGIESPQDADERNREQATYPGNDEYPCLDGDAELRDMRGDLIGCVDPEFPRRVDTASLFAQSEAAAKMPLDCPPGFERYGDVCEPMCTGYDDMFCYDREIDEARATYPRDEATYPAPTARSIPRQLVEIAKTLGRIGRAIVTRNP